jgi:hypothetical protein
MLTDMQRFVLRQQAFDSTGKPFAVGRDATSSGVSNQVTIAAGGFTVVDLVRG